MKRNDVHYQLGCFLLMLSVFSAKTEAMMPVVDVSAIDTLNNQFHEMQSQSSQLNNLDQLDQHMDETTTELLHDQEGHYGFGELYNTDEDLTEKAYSPSTWEDTINDLSGGNTERYQQLIDQYHQDNPTMSSDDYAKGTTSQDAANHEQQSDLTTASSVNAAYAYDNVDDELSRVHDLTQQIDHTINTKSAIDLNSRMSAELAYMQIESLKMQAIMNQQLASQSQTTLGNEQLEASYRALPDE